MKICVIAMLLLSLQACGMWNAKSVDIVKTDTSLHGLAVHQQVELKTTRGDYLRFEALIESSPQVLKIALLSEFGENFMTLELSDGSLAVTERSLSSSIIEIDLLALSLQRIFWPESALKQFSLQRGWRIVRRPKIREFYRGESLLATASYSELNPWDSHVQYVDIEHGFNLIVKSAQLTQ